MYLVIDVYNNRHLELFCKFIPSLMSGCNRKEKLIALLQHKLFDTPFIYKFEYSHRDKNVIQLSK